MKASINKKLWVRMNIFAKVFLVIGMFCMDISMKLSGLDQEETK